MLWRISIRSMTAGIDGTETSLSMSSICSKVVGQGKV
jgi:hypothetical protein